jgi:putative DNA primase/helicase
MQDFASENEAVRQTLSKEREESARLDFAEEDWKMQLEYNRQGIVVNNLRNLLLILNNDEKLKSIVFNQLSDLYVKRSFIVIILQSL